jgi:hypothetical protein
MSPLEGLARPRALPRPPPYGAVERSARAWSPGRQGTSDRYTDGQVWGSPHAGAKMAFDVGIVEPNSISHSARSGCNQPFLNVNAGTRDEEREKVKRYKVLCNLRGLTFVPIIFTTCGGMGEAATNLASTLEEGRGRGR